MNPVNLEVDFLHKGKLFRVTASSRNVNLRPVRRAAYIDHAFR